MALADHLRELRNRLFKSALALLVGGVGGWLLYDTVFEQIQRPIFEIAAQQHRTAVINFDSIASPFDLKIQGALFIGALISSPVWIYQIWAFITPGLTSKERRYTLGYMAAAIPLFLVGVWTGWLVLPNVVRALTQFAPSETASVLPATDYITFVMRMLLALGFAFLVPVILVGVNMAGVLTGKQMLKAWRITVFLVFVVAAMAAPGADALSMFLLASPLLVLYFAAIGISLLHDRRRERREAKRTAETEATADVATSREDLDSL
ncbi:twin-arginine translocase subunit TatC [Paenarthrobacter sp. DKR-5]|uniref:twin-arginine translocase subunit TatC n=1 Tax=Paenarthrobacter sp. DKR-5 TaxID=2835535 RepID=UPI001BDBDE4A|nr:twin-arginine translocase subunit TatC [Paenarthrobacter sp. DKR-5]MBT1001768.1 twin-arginine translocase subunit TatC [Paenarthrobacter sp. DKR-5]